MLRSAAGTASAPGEEYRTPTEEDGTSSSPTSKNLPDFAVNAAWLTAAMTGQILLAWLKLLTLDGDLASAEPRRGGRPLHPPPDWPAAATAPPENPGHLAMGRGDHHCLAAHRRPSASP